MKHPAEPQTIRFISDEKNVCQDQKHNTQNNRWLAYSPNDTPHDMQTKLSQTAMVFGCVSCEGLRLNSDAYVELLITVVKPRITRMSYGRPYVWQQDSATCHTSGKSQKLLLANSYDCTSPNVWPSNSPDLSPMDFHVEKDVNRHESTTKVQLID